MLPQPAVNSAGYLQLWSRRLFGWYPAGEAAWHSSTREGNTRGPRMETASGEKVELVMKVVSLEPIRLHPNGTKRNFH